MEVFQIDVSLKHDMFIATIFIRAQINNEKYFKKYI